VGANRYRPSKQQLLAIAAAVLVLALATVRSRHLSAAELQRVVARTYPAGAAKYVEDRQPAGPLYNDFDWGGYLIWRLPSYPVTMDGRGGQRIERYNTWMAKDGWASDQELSTARLVIANLDLPLTTELRRDPRFQLVYQDKVAAVFLTRTSK